MILWTMFRNLNATWVFSWGRRHCRFNTELVGRACATVVQSPLFFSQECFRLTSGPVSLPAIVLGNTP